MFNRYYQNVTAQILWSVKCHKCEEETKGIFFLDRATFTPTFVKPEGWFDIDGILFCPKHHVVVENLVPEGLKTRW